MRTKLVNTTADVIHRALQRCETSAGIAIALDSAGLLMSPETAAELAVLREDIATADQDVVEAQRHNDATCEAAAALDRVRFLHAREDEADYCTVCANHGDIQWPCRTVAAINGWHPAGQVCPDCGIGSSAWCPGCGACRCGSHRDGCPTAKRADDEMAALVPGASRCVLHGSACDGDMEQAHIMQPARPAAERPLLDPRSFDRPGQRAAARMLNADERRPVTLATDCANCGHTYNWHDGACVAGRDEECGCTNFAPKAGER